MKLQTGTKPHSIRKLEKKCNVDGFWNHMLMLFCGVMKKNVNLGVAMPGKIIIKLLWYFIYIFTAIWCALSKVLEVTYVFHITQYNCVRRRFKNGD